MGNEDPEVVGPASRWTMSPIRTILAVAAATGTVIEIPAVVAIAGAVQRGEATIQEVLHLLFGV